MKDHCKGTVKDPIAHTTEHLFDSDSAIDVETEITSLNQVASDHMLARAVELEVIEIRDEDEDDVIDLSLLEDTIEGGDSKSFPRSSSCSSSSTARQDLHPRWYSEAERSSRSALQPASTSRKRRRRDGGELCEVVVIDDDGDDAATPPPSIKRKKEQAVSTSPSAHISIPKRPKTIVQDSALVWEPGECIGCMEQKLKTLKMSCTHHYCHPCILRLCESALKDRSYVPLRCCSIKLSRSIIEASLTVKQLSQYDRYLDEIQNPKKPMRIDPAVIELMVDREWKPCPRCGCIVEKDQGCVHITCKCQHEFCFTCIKTWKTCGCEVYPYEEIERILAEGKKKTGGASGEARATADFMRRQNQEQRKRHLHQWNKVRLRQNVPAQECGRCSYKLCFHYFFCNACHHIRCQMCRYNL
ncbi:hypothetical protein HDU67_004913 [Dinochytrium kinnereticum]|nr:hypothetical protein HDU67_004913 [Dinochytrium kinnereticum]